ncbi:hypothetical protein HID58_033675 [Brassica napus]|uniref:FAS1 domain-containing protein n=1 Tax=Brassica napus TaxID=3708 RepID=A0ABQ8BZX3_BRANA|nr:hypothetical protein HID58_033675 [Brassica napus]
MNIHIQSLVRAAVRVDSSGFLLAGKGKLEPLRAPFNRLSIMVMRKGMNFIRAVVSTTSIFSVQSSSSSAAHKGEREILSKANVKDFTFNDLRLATRKLVPFHLIPSSPRRLRRDLRLLMGTPKRIFIRPFPLPSSAKRIIVR